MPLPDITTQSIRKFTFTVAKPAGALVNRATLAQGFRATGPNSAVVPLTNISIAPAGNAASMAVVAGFDARARPNGGPWTVQALPTIADVLGNAISSTNLDTFTINIPNNPTPVWATEHIFTAPGATLPAGWIATGIAAPTFSSNGMRIEGTATVGWGVRVLESAPFTYSDGKIVEIDFLGTFSLGAIGLGVKNADGGFGDFNDADSLMWWGTSGNLTNGASEYADDGAGEWVGNRPYRIRFKRVGLNTEVTYSKDTGSGFAPIRSTVTVVTPTPLTASTTRILLDTAYSSELIVRRVAIS
jgi:hypothetical protein